MENLVVMNIECEGLEERDSATILQIPFDISWQDLKLLLELHLECQDIQVQYLDDEHDFVNINRQEELCEAFKVARMCGNVLNVRVIPSHRTKVKSGQDPIQVVLTDSGDREVSLVTTGQQDEVVNLDDEKEDQTNREATGDVVMAEGTCMETGACEMSQIAATTLTESAGTSDHPDATMECLLPPPPPVPPRMRTDKPPVHKLKKKEVNSLLSVARELGHRRRRGISFRHRQFHQDSREDNAESDEGVSSDNEMPPLWFQLYMDKFKREISDEIANLVSRRVVRQVVGSLDGAVIHSVAGTSGQPAASEAPGPDHTNSQDRCPVYCHTGIICDACDQTIVGVRYKCGNCEDYDLCEQCEMKDGIHDSDHVFIKIRRPILMAGRRKNGRMSPLFKKSLYHTEESRTREVESFAAFQWEKFQEKILKKAEKLKRKEEKFEEQMKRKEEKLKRRMEHQRETPHKKEKLDIPQCKMKQRMDAVFMKDDTIPDGTHVQPGTRLLKRWLMKNTGTHSFTQDTKLSLMWGNLPPVEAEVSVPYLQPGEEGLFTVEHVAPQEPGKYQSHWRLYNKGVRFGHRIWCSVIVDQKEVLEPSSEGLLSVVPASQQQKSVQNSAEMTEVATLLKEQVKLSPTESEASPAVLSPQDLLSFEMLEIRDRSPPEVSQTATPTNTPLDVTPPKSPVPELSDLAARQLSNSSSSVEIVTDDVEEAAATVLMTEMVQQKMASLGMRPDESEDGDEVIESLSSDSDLDSDLTDSEFYIVPLPDCFQPDKPISRSVSECNTDGVLVSEGSAEEPDVVVVEAESELGGADIVIIEEEELPAAERSTEDTEVLIVDVTDDVLVKSGSEHDSAETVIEVSSSAGVTQRAPLTSAQELQLQQHSDEENNNNNPAIQGEQMQAQTEQVDEVDGTEQTDVKVARPKTPPSPAAVAGTIMNSALNVASHAAAAAYTTAKDVFHTLQARNQYVPPLSNWKPPSRPYVPKKSEWTPPKDTFVPPKSEWTPPKQTWTPTMANCCPNDEEVGPMEQLFEMGFCNRGRNESLLQKHDNNVEKVIQELLTEDDANWFDNRH